ncbi:hypothetical protein CEXT_650651, partial [Caerostris extrusa]
FGRYSEIFIHSLLKENKKHHQLCLQTVPLRIKVTREEVCRNTDHKAPRFTPSQSKIVYRTCLPATLANFWQHFSTLRFLSGPLTKSSRDSTTQPTNDNKWPHYYEDLFPPFLRFPTLGFGIYHSEERFSSNPEEINGSFINNR